MEAHLIVDTIVGRHGGLRAVLAQVALVAPTDATVLISGATGTGTLPISSDTVVAVSSPSTFGQAESSVIVEALRAAAGRIAGKGEPQNGSASNVQPCRTRFAASASQKHNIRTSQRTQGAAMHDHP
jgi:hypothetical protein